MTKDLRLTLRITEELDLWLKAESEQLGLDKAAFARLVLFQRKNGAQILAASPSPIAPTARDVLDVSAPTAPEPASEPIDIDDLVAEQLAEADAQGLTQPREREDAQVMPEGGVRSLGPRRPPPYSPQTQPSWIQR